MTEQTLPDHAVLFSKTEEVVHRGWDTGRKRIFCLGHKQKIPKQIHEPKLKEMNCQIGKNVIACPGLQLDY